MIFRYPKGVEVYEYMVRKIGTEEVMRISSHGKSLYLRIPKNLAEAFGLKAGDNLRVKIQEIVSREEDQ